MNDNCFVDTNVIVYCYTVDEPVKKQMALEIASNSGMFISTQVLTELSNTLKKKFNLNWQSIENVISEISLNFNVYINKPETIKKACLIAEKYQYSFYDSLIIAAALSSNCKTLFSEDMQKGQIIENTLTIINPFKYTARTW